MPGEEGSKQQSTIAI
ncbi:hypothetical protein A2U01_0117870, partial [Trifolium medium]|nr:hypothetical protein [Trifolium medium]